MINSRMLFAAGVFLFGLMQGCTMVQTYPLAARAGDTITIAPGSLDGATKTNLTVQYYSNSNPSTPINLSPYIRSVFNITPDRTSPVWTSSLADNIPNGSGHGPWQTVVAIDLPATGLPLGPGNIRVSLGAGVSAPSNATSPAGINMPLEILPGTGTKNSFSYTPYTFLGAPVVTIGDITQLKPGNQYVVKPTPSGGSYFGINYAAAEYTLYMPIRDSDGAVVADTLDFLRVILDPHPLSDAYQVNLNWRRDGDNLIVYVTSPQNKLNDRQTRFSVVLSSDAALMFYGAASILGVKYFNINGTVVATTPLPILQRINL